MEILSLGAKFGIYVIFALTLLFAFISVTVRNIFHAALGLVFTLLGIAGVYFVLRADFIAAIQILLYVGAIMTLLVFAVMLTFRMGDKKIMTSNRQQYPVAILSLLLVYFLVRQLGKTAWQLKDTLTSIDAIQIGKELMGPYVLPFEIISLVLVVALVGAIVVARSES